MENSLSPKNSIDFIIRHRVEANISSVNSKLIGSDFMRSIRGPPSEIRVCPADDRTACASLKLPALKFIPVAAMIVRDRHRRCGSIGIASSSHSIKTYGRAFRLHNEPQLTRNTSSGVAVQPFIRGDTKNTHAHTQT